MVLKYHRMDEQSMIFTKRLNSENTDWKKEGILWKKFGNARGKKCSSKTCSLSNVGMEHLLHHNSCPESMHCEAVEWRFLNYTRKVMQMKLLSILTWFVLKFQKISFKNFPIPANSFLDFTLSIRAKRGVLSSGNAVRFCSWTLVSSILFWSNSTITLDWKCCW